MRKVNLLVAACAMVLGVSEIGAMIPAQRPQMTQQNHDNMVQEYVWRLDRNFSNGNSWQETMDEADENGVLDEVLTHQYSMTPNALLNAIERGANFAGNPWEVWGSPEIRATLLTQTAIRGRDMNAIGFALEYHYDNNTLFQLVNNARLEGVLDTVLLHHEQPGESTFLSFITHYRSESLVKQVIQMVRDTNPALLRQLITDQVIEKARQIDSPILPLLEQIKRGIDGII